MSIRGIFSGVVCLAVGFGAGTFLGPQLLGSAEKTPSGPKVALSAVGVTPQTAGMSVKTRCFPVEICENNGLCHTCPIPQNVCGEAAKGKVCSGPSSDIALCNWSVDGNEVVAKVPSKCETASHSSCDKCLGKDAPESCTCDGIIFQRTPGEKG